MIGETILHYKILEKLGEGGMGVVYKAEDTKLKREVAIKFLPHHISTNEEERKRFEIEAQAAASLNHPNITTIHSIDEANGEVFIVMEYIKGIELKDKIKSGTISNDAAINIALQIAEGLEAAHKKGIVHRDIKSQNIMITNDGKVKIMDFGLAKIKGGTQVTKLGSTVGTVAYMSPEQTKGEDLDYRSDIWSFGVVLYEMLTGQLPFKGDYEQAVMYSILNEPPQPIQGMVADTPSVVIHVLDRTLEKDMTLRYQSMSEVLIELRRLHLSGSRISSLSGPSIQGIKIPETVKAKRSNKNVIWFAAAFVALAVIAVFFFFNPFSSRPAINPDMSTSVLQIPATEYEYPDMSPDGKWLAFPGSDVNRKWDIYMMFIETGESRRLTKDSSQSLGGSATAKFSPDGSSIAYGRLKKGTNIAEICVVSVLTGSSRVVADTGVAPHWNNKGDRIFYYREGKQGRVPSRTGWREYWSVSSQGRDTKLEFIDSLAEGSSRYFTFDISPDGKKIAFTRPMKGNYNEIILRDLASGKETQLTNDKKTIDEVEWTNNGYIFYSSNRSGNFNIWALPDDGGESIQITRGGGPDEGIAVSTAENRMIFSQSSLSATLWQVNLDGTGLHQLFPDENIEQGQISPDGKTIAMMIHKSNTTHTLMTRDLSGEQQEILFPFEEGVTLRDPVWSPSGGLLSFLEIKNSNQIRSLHTKIIDMNSRQVRDLGEGIVQEWMSDSVVEIRRNISPDIKKPNFNSTHLLNINSGMEKPVYKDSMRATLVLNNSMIGYLDKKSNFYFVSQSELSRNPAAKGTFVMNTDKIRWAGINGPALYYILKGENKIWKYDIQTKKTTKHFSLPPGDYDNFELDKVHNLITFGKFRNKTSIVKIDNLFKD